MKKLSTFWPKNIKFNEKVALLLSFAGFATSYFLPDDFFNLDFVWEGFFIGLWIGLTWAFGRYMFGGLQGLEKTQSDFSQVVIYLGFFLVGLLPGYLIFKVIPLFLSLR
jgi:hypothetical protein